METRTNWERVGNIRGKMYWRKYVPMFVLLVGSGSKTPGKPWKWAVTMPHQKDDKEVRVVKEGSASTARAARQKAERAYIKVLERYAREKGARA